MARFVIEKHNKRKPMWLLSVLACFPFDRNKSYPDIERYAIMGRYCAIWWILPISAETRWSASALLTVSM